MRRLLVACAATVVSLLLVEGLLHWMQPGRFTPARILTPDGSEVPLGEIAHFLRKSGELDRYAKAGPRARMQPNLWYQIVYEAPRWSRHEANIEYRHNSLGFRDLEFPVEKPPGELRILALGDSFTFGMGTNLEDTWPQVLESRLAAQRPGPVQVINGGFAAGSYYPPGYLDWLRTDGLRFEPDLLILGFCLNDMSVDIPMLGYPLADPAPWLGGASEILRFFQFRLEQRRLKAEQRDFTELVRQDDSTWQETQAALVEMRDLLAERDVGFVVVVFPMLSQLGDDYPYLGLHEMVTSFCRENAISCVDLLPLVRGRDDEDLWAHPKDQHPNRDGHWIFAEGIEEHLEREGLLN